MARNLPQTGTTPLNLHDELSEGPLDRSAACLALCSCPNFNLLLGTSTQKLGSYPRRVRESTAWHRLRAHAYHVLGGDFLRRGHDPHEVGWLQACARSLNLRTLTCPSRSGRGHVCTCPCVCVCMCVRVHVCGGVGAYEVYGAYGRIRV